MSAPPPSSFSTEVLILAFFVLIVARRTIAMVQGTRYSAARMFGFTGFYVALFLLLASGTIVVAAQAWGLGGELLVAPYIAVLVVAALIAAPYVRRIVRFEVRDGGERYYRLPWVVPVLYLLLFVVRIAMELVLFGPAAFNFTLPTSVSTTALALLVAVDLLFAGSTGLLLGRSVGVYYAHRDLERAGAPPPGPAPTSPPLP
jgi:hypothetical protein